jgi:hypothetical protein
MEHMRNGILAAIILMTLVGFLIGVYHYPIIMIVVSYMVGIWMVFFLWWSIKYILDILLDKR